MSPLVDFIVKILSHTLIRMKTDTPFSSNSSKSSNPMKQNGVFWQQLYILVVRVEQLPKPY